ncbi:3-isopropylmalate dehydrogenase [Scytonema sp. HK-05]|nr:3-isopropylmalate dehydrogenase [Scytonema sp. HK-05]
MCRKNLLKFDIHFEFQKPLIGSAAIDATGKPLPAARVLATNSIASCTTRFYYELVALVRQTAASPSKSPLAPVEPVALVQQPVALVQQPVALVQQPA